MGQVVEDMKLVTHIRDLFLALNDFAVGDFSSAIQCSMKNTSPLVYVFLLVYVCVCFVHICMYVYENLCSIHIC